ncbi:dienelactone hydrolase family protein [Pseudocolwellia sp. HL-MZ7]|uniref:dienelactone hydrolase family protein n=1 Tax=Pseudocolwellia sp. HL-MZ7 TaxID=3400627 RepID=UPI003CFB2978
MTDQVKLSPVSANNITNIYIVADIFGITPALLELKDELATSLALANKSVSFIIIVDPYQGQQMNFDNETNAYEYFIERVGVEKYAQHLYSILSNQTINLLNKSQNSLKAKTRAKTKAKTKVIGFSVGAAAMWSISDKDNLNVEQAIYFYGSQIRHLTHIHPKMESTVVLPAMEEHFDLDVLQERLENLSLISIKRSRFYHGFMNKKSINFDPQAYRTYNAWLFEELTRPRGLLS